jgi:hypothetical protein
LISDRRPFASSLRFFDARVGRVGRRGFGRSVAWRISSTRRSTASSRLRSWVRNRWAVMMRTPSFVSRFPANRSSFSFT